MSGTSESELRAMLRDLGVGGTFVGTFDNSFGGFRRLDIPQCAIVNTGSRRSGGVHWIAVAYHPARARFYVFDPLGWTDCQLNRLYRFSLQPLLRRTFQRLRASHSHARQEVCLHITRNTQAVQCSCAGSCGLFCLMFIYAFARHPGVAMTDGVIQRLDGEQPALIQNRWPALHANQEKLYRFLHARSVYFRRHENTIVNNTRVGLVKTHAFY